MRTGQSAKRSRKFARCCCTSSVVGASTATCLPACTATKAARIATSVLPKPTSPHTMRSIGRSLCQIGEHLADRLRPDRRSPRTGRRWRRPGSRARGSGRREALLRLAARVQVEQLRGHVADLLGGALARARPLIGAELVQRRALGRGAGVAADQVQRVHRHVDAVAVLVLEHQELAAAARRSPSACRPDVAADAVLLVHHRRAGIEVLQVAQDRLRIGAARLRRRSWRARAPNSCASEMTAIGGAVSVRPSRSGATVSASARGAVGELHPSSRTRRHRVAVGAQHLLQHLAPARPSRPRSARGPRSRAGTHRAARTAARRAHRCAARAARWWGNCARRRVPARSSVSALKASSVIAAKLRERRRRAAAGSRNSSRGREHRTLDVVAAILVARARCPARRSQRAGERRVVHDHRIARQVVEQRRGRLEEQRQVELDPRRREPLAHAAVDAGCGRLALEARAEAAAEILDRLRRRAAPRAPAAGARSRAHRASAAFPDRSGGSPRSRRRTDRCAAASPRPSERHRAASRAPRTRPGSPPG